MKKNKICFVILFIINIFLSGVSHAQQTLRITTGFTAPVSTYYKNLFAEINRRYPQYHFVFGELPAERSLMLANRGINDGECCRIPDVVTRQYPNLIPVPQKVYSIRWVAFSSEDLGIHDWKDIKSYNAVTVTGWKLAEKQLAALKPASLEVVRSPDIMMRLLDHKRAEVGVMGYMSGLKSIHDTGSTHVRYISRPLAISPLYLMLNNKHKDLVPELTKILKTFDGDGTLKRIYRETIKAYEQIPTK